MHSFISTKTVDNNSIQQVGFYLCLIPEDHFQMKTLGRQSNKMNIDQLPQVRYVRLHSTEFIPSQRGELVKIHLVAITDADAWE